jgi:citrate synthase
MAFNGRRAGMQIGKRGPATTAISTADADHVVVRGRDLAGDLMGSLSFTEFFFLLATGRSPNAEQRFFIDLSLVAIAEHGLVPTVQAARMTYAADPGALQGAVAAGVLGCGAIILGTADHCRKLIDEVLRRVDAGLSMEQACAEIATELRAAGKSIPGYGHPLHKPLDPRAERMMEFARQRGVAGRAVECAAVMTKAVAAAWGKSLPMNVSMSIAATLHDVDVPAFLIRGIPILARTAGLIAHLAEESEAPIGFTLAAGAEASIGYSGERLADSPP